MIDFSDLPQAFDSPGILEVEAYTRFGAQGDAEGLIKRLDSIAELWLRDDRYIWNVKPPAWSIASSDVGSFLCGRLEFGDCIEDEWFVVWMLREMSKISGPDVAIRIHDDDGEFLLIESAMHLPRWLEPSCEANRAWMLRGSLHIVPPLLPKQHTGVIPALELKDALAYIWAEQEMIQSHKLDHHAFARLKHYPDKAQIEMHWASCLLPRAFATVIHEDPQLISRVAASFSALRQTDMTTLQHQTAIDTSDLVVVSVKMSRTMYAKFKSTRFSGNTIYPDVSADRDALALGARLVAGALQADLAQLIRQRASHPLPRDSEIRQNWPGHQSSDAFLDVDHEQLQAKLAESDSESDIDSGPNCRGSGDSDPLSNLAEQMRKFMSGKAGLEGVDLDDDDIDESDGDNSVAANDEDDDDDSDDDDNDDNDESSSDRRNAYAGTRESEPQSASDFLKFLEKSLQNMATMSGRMAEHGESLHDHRDFEWDNDNDDGDDDDDSSSIDNMEQYMAAMDNELGAIRDPRSKATGSFRHDLRNDDDRADSCNQAMDAENEQSEQGDDEVDSDDGMDFEMARNLLNSLRSEGGSGGPTSQLLLSLGIDLPRDDDDYGESEETSTDGE
ncbi:hypothetical protein PYCC9005_000049 [Savitreella phatthalungensis]